MKADALWFWAIVAADRIFKALIPRLLELHQSITVIPGFFQITYVKNTGGAFGILAGWDSPIRRGFFIFASIAALALLFFLYRQAVTSASTPLRFALILIAAGAMGNLYDRCITGEVVDFLDFFVGRHHYPAFNLADSAITIGAVFMAFLYLTGRADLPADQKKTDVP
jgi:signal peptidase II